MAGNKNKSLLEDITSQEIEALKQIELLRQRGHEIIYFIDPNDIVRYCFPFGLRRSENADARESRPLEYISDEQITYHLTRTTLTHQLLIIDDYIEEYNNFKGQVNYNREKGFNLLDSFEEFRDSYESKNTRDSVLALSDLQVSLLLSIVLGDFQNGISILNKLDTELVKFIGEYDEFGEEVQDEWYRKLSELYLRSHKKVYTDDFIDALRAANFQRISSKYYDCRAFDVMIQMNNLNKTNTIFLLIGSDQSFKRMAEYAVREDILPVIDGIPLTPIINTSQLFLYHLLVDQQQEDHNLTSLLTEFQEIVLEKEQGVPRAGKWINHELQESFNRRISQFREKFENISLINKFPLYKDAIDEIFSDNKLKNYDNVLNGISKLKELYAQPEYLLREKSAALNNLKREHSFKAAIVNGLDLVKLEGRSFEKRPGGDYVTNIFHQLPIVFSFTTPAYQDIAERIVSFIIQFQTQRDDPFEKTANFIFFINQIIVDTFDESTGDTNYEEELIRILIYLVLPAQAQNNPETNSLKRLQKILQSGNLVKSPKMKADFLYVASWLARRMEDYELAETYAREGLQIDADDPRFYHSLCLIFYCYMRRSKDRSYLSQRLEYCSKAIELYEKIEDNRIEVQKSVNVLINSKIYTLCQMYDMLERENQSLLDEAGELLKLLRQREESFDMMPEFLHTEAYYLFLRQNVHKSPAGLEAANSLLQQALDIGGVTHPKRNEYYHELKKKIEKAIRK